MLMNLFWSKTDDLTVSLTETNPSLETPRTEQGPRRITCPPPLTQGHRPRQGALGFHLNLRGWSPGRNQRSRGSTIGDKDRPLLENDGPSLKALYSCLREHKSEKQNNKPLFYHCARQILLTTDLPHATNH